MQQEDRFELSEVEKIKLDIGYANLFVEETEGDQIKVNMKDDDIGAEYKCHVKENGKLHVKYDMHGTHVVKEKTTSEVHLLIPKGKTFQTVKMELGAGEAQIVPDVLNCEMMTVEVGAGKVLAGAIKVNGVLTVEVGAGKMKLANADIGSAVIECGVGKFQMNGKIATNLEANCGVGNMEMDLLGREEDYNFEVSCALGKVTVNDSKLGHFASNKTMTNSNAVGKITLNCGLGKIKLNTVA